MRWAFVGASLLTACGSSKNTADALAADAPGAEPPAQAEAGAETPPGDSSTAEAQEAPHDAAGGEPSGQDPAPGAYGRRKDLIEANSEMAVAEVGGKIYVVGGYPSSRIVQTTVQIYEPASDSWSLGPPHPTPIHHPVLASSEGKLYSLGGQIAMSGEVDSRRVFVLDPAAPPWREVQPMPTARGAGAAAVVGGKIYVVGGRPPAGNAFEAYEVAADRWEKLPPLPLGENDRNHLAATAIGGKIYVAGGRYDGGGVGSPRTASLDVFDPGTGMWTKGMDMPRPRGGVNGIAAGGCFHVWGGEGSGTGEPGDVFPDHDVYNPATDRWTKLVPLPTPIHGVTGAAFLDGVIYMPGGGTTSGGSSGSVIFQVYRPAGCP